MNSSNTSSNSLSNCTISTDDEGRIVFDCQPRESGPSATVTVDPNSGEVVPSVGYTLRW
jgi:hypothetical protein